MKKIIYHLILFCLFVSTAASAQKREKYEFMRNLPVYADSLIADLTYPMAWGNSKVKNRNGSASDWWERSPQGSDPMFFCAVRSRGNAGYDGASYANGVAFAFCF